MTNKIEILTSAVSHACYLALGAELGDQDVKPGTPAHEELHETAGLLLEFFQEDPKAVARALKRVTTPVVDTNLPNLGPALGFLLGLPHWSERKDPLPASTIAALLDLLADAHARHKRLLAAERDCVDGLWILQSTALVNALDCVPQWCNRQVPGGAFLNFMAHEGVPAWLVESVRPDGVHAVHGFAFGDIGDLWTNAVKGMPGEAWCRPMGLGAVADLAVHAQALHLLMHTPAAEYAAGAQYMWLGIMGQGTPAQALMEPAAQWWASSNAMVAASKAVKEAGEPLHAIKRLVRTLSEGYTVATGMAPLLGLSEADALLLQWEGEVNDWCDVLHARGSALAGKLVPVRIPAHSAKRVKKSLNKQWEEGLEVASNDK